MMVKIFLGTRLIPELRRRHLGENETFEQIPYQGKEYLGFYFETPHPTLQEIRTMSHHLTTTLQAQCPDLRADQLQIVLFPQLFVGST